MAMPSNRSSWHAKSVLDLYQERDGEAWYWRWLAALASSLILLGFMVFPASFTTTTNTVASPGTLSVVAVVLLALGYSLSVALWFICESWLFQFDFIFIPCLLSSALGALNTAISLSIHPTAPSNWSTSSIAALVLSLVSSLIYTALAILIHLKIRSNTQSDNKRLSNPESYPLFSEEELQRQRFQKLLAQQNTSPRVSPETSSTTFRIDIPDDARAARNPPLHTPLPLATLGTAGASGAGENTLSHLAAPSATYESAERSRNAQSRSLQHPSQTSRSYHEDSVNARQAALSAARERERNHRYTSLAQNAHMPPPSPASHGGPPVIVNTRHPYASHLSSIPFEERHPLERGEEEVDFVPGRGSKDKEEYERIREGADGGVWRPDEHEEEEEDGAGEREQDAGPAWEIVEGGDVVLDLGEFRRSVPTRLPGHGHGHGPHGAGAGARESPVSALSPGQTHGHREIGLSSNGEGSSTGGSGSGSGSANGKGRWPGTPEELDSRERLELDGRFARR